MPLHLQIVVDNTISKSDYEHLMDFCATLDRGNVPEWKAIMMLNLAYRLPDLIEDENRGSAWIRRLLVVDNLSEVGCVQVYIWLRDHVRHIRKPHYA